MNLADVKKSIVEGNGNTSVSIKIPSTGITYQFNPITVGVRKTLAKYSLNTYSKDALLNFQVGKLALIKTLCTDEKFEEINLTEVDFIYVLACLRQFNLLDDFMVTALCPKCHKEVVHKLDLDAIVSRCEAFEHNTFEISKKDKKNNIWKFVLSDPTMYNVIILEKYLVDHDMDETDKDLMKPFLYIEKLYFNDELIEDFAKLNVIEKINFINDLDDRIMYAKTGVANTINEKFADSFKIYDGIRCNNKDCDHTLEDIITSDSFFTF